MKLTRRDFIKSNAIAATATAAGITIPGVKEVLAKSNNVQTNIFRLLFKIGFVSFFWE